MKAVESLSRVSAKAPLALSLLLITCSAVAQSYDIGNTTYSQNFQIHGQSFTPSTTGFGFPAPPIGLSQVSLTSFTFLQSEPSTPAASLYIVPESVLLIDGVNLSTVLSDLETYAIAQAGNPTETAGDFDGQFTGIGPGNYTTVTYDFVGGVTLDFNAGYIAFLGGGLTYSQIAGLAPGADYSGGSVYDAGGADENFDATFMATFTPVPEPASASLLAGIAAGLLAWRRRRIRG